MPEDEQVSVTPAHRDVGGKELYEIYAEAMEQENIGVDTWPDIGRHEQRAWESLASSVLLKEYLA